MVDMLLKRVAQSGAVLLFMSLLAFAGIHLIGDPIYILVNPNATADEIAAASRHLGLDLPVYQQYWHFAWNALHGDLGTSFVFNRPVLALVAERIPATLELAFCALLLAIGIGIPLGLIAGLRPNGGLHKVIMAGSVLGITMPSFWMGLLFILLFSVQLGWLPSGGRGPTVDILGLDLSITTWNGVRHLLLPALTLALFKIALVIRLTEAGTREVSSQEFIKFARAKGVSGARLMFRHIAPNVMIPIITVLGLEFGHLIAFSLVTESIFAWPGMGKLIIDSILHLDRPVVVAYLMLTLLIIISINLCVDFLYLLIDPRLRSKLN
ncbi:MULTISPECIES: ABC transporter permease [unclassified Undibacterium]|uniref:ABC transporter permease n=1 Tax=unclassified Undibacterium TaxID=2630295 RepID=UPI002AC9EC66|nr:MULTISPECIES: ABC transporter permease [unclassified Undibacterium]MEB0138305.1 ABC transporter permease [Undibacterium sp. CCC2.1]MEB0170791.1 ABC transporter permease [Undibacterium sp. CCC1.1]MEB0174680.1 ABC transporter permease [Undibacterium sp. CCC3.4]MEB0213877.1 ABC transporter permease [Undibacterium sp. 5I2]WPX42603.1 ABC transporter permease [Undibacterium sp. CCC3.4]